MSDEPEDSLLEALRNDLPSNDASARVRRRLLAAGVAVGNGVAAGTAAASTTSGAAGLAAKVAGLSWGVKLGALAVVAIPSVGLVMDRTLFPEPAPRAPAATPAGVRAPARGASASLAARPLLPGVQPAAPLPEPRPLAPAASLSAPGSSAPSAEVTPGQSREASPARPSQVDFAAVEAPSDAKAASTLAEETRLLDGAFGELSAGNTARAAELVAEHQRRFPNGLLKKERERARTRLSEMSRGE